MKHRNLDYYRIIESARMVGIGLSEIEAFDIWTRYSLDKGRSWLPLPKSDDDLSKIIKSYSWYTTGVV